MSKNRRTDYSAPPNLYLLLITLTAIVVIWVYYLVNRPTVTFIQLDSSLVQVSHRDYNQTPLQHSKQSDESGSDDFDIKLMEWSQEEAACHALSNVKANDPIVDDYLKNVSMLCPFQKELTNLNQMTGILTHVASKDYTCYYTFFKREDEADNWIVYEKMNQFDSQPVLMTPVKNLVNTSCFDVMGLRIYLNTHLFIPELKSDEVISPDKPSVVVLFLESLPQLSFQRFMNRTIYALDELGSVQYFDYFVKPMDNSFPNTMAFLTGKRIPWSEEKELKNDYFDGKFRYLWDEFKDNGYVTALEEDLSIVGVFNYGKWGFKNDPCDFNPRSFWVQMYPETGDYQIGKSMSDPMQFCFHKNGAKVSLFLDHLKTLMIKNARHPHFAFYFYSQMTHEDFNNYKIADPYFADFFTSIKPLINNTILLFAGDHGFRMGSFVATSMGRLEERMNMVSIRVPDAVHQKYPHLRKYLSANKQSLLSWYDLHLMLKQVATGEFRSVDREAALTFPVNPMTQLVPKNRTCHDANIDSIYCVCNDRINVDPVGQYFEHDVKPAQAAVQRFITKHLIKNSCQAQTVNQTLAFSYQIPWPGESFYPIETAFIEVLLSPSNLTFESTLIRNLLATNYDFHVITQGDPENEVSDITKLKSLICKGV